MDERAAREIRGGLEALAQGLAWCGACIGAGLAALGWLRLFVK